MSEETKLHRVQQEEHLPAAEDVKAKLLAVYPPRWPGSGPSILWSTSRRRPR